MLTVLPTLIYLALFPPYLRAQFSAIFGQKFETFSSQCMQFAMVRSLVCSLTSVALTQKRIINSNRYN
jgi:hypothetical protein